MFESESNKPPVEDAASDSLTAMQAPTASAPNAPGGQGAPPAPPAPARACRTQGRCAYEWTLLGVLVVLIAGIMALRFVGPAVSDDAIDVGGGDGVPRADFFLRLQGRSAVGFSRLMTGSPASQRDRELSKLQREVDKLAATPADQIRAAIIAGELFGEATALDRLNELDGDSPFRLAPLPDVLAQDIDRLRRLYKDGQDALDEHERAALTDHHEWFGDLALSHGLPDASEQRQRAFAPPTRTVVGLVGMMVAGGGAFLLGIVLLIVAGVMFYRGRFRWAMSQPPLPAAMPGALPGAGAIPGGAGGQYGAGFATWPQGYQYAMAPAPPPHAYAAPGGAYAPWPKPVDTIAWAASSEPPRARIAFLEAFVLFLLGVPAVGLIAGLVSNQVPHEIAIQLLWLLAIVPFWVRLRGVSWATMRSALGWHKGRGIVREMIAGVAGYLAGLPLLALGAIATMVLIGISQAAEPLLHQHVLPQVAPAPGSSDVDGGPLVDADAYNTGAPPTPAPIHPIVGELASASVGQIVLLFALAALWAPLLEETMFRGALHYYFRGRWRILASALVGGFIFAAIHPQGIFAIPPLMALGATFSFIREWRGSLVATITAHACNNAALLTLVVFVAR